MVLREKLLILWMKSWFFLLQKEYGIDERTEIHEMRLKNVTHVLSELGIRSTVIFDVNITEYNEFRCEFTSTNEDICSAIIAVKFEGEHFS